MAAGNGSLSCVGMGMMLGAHIGPRARATIEQEEVVFGAVPDPIVELGLQQMRPDVRSLQPCYAEGKNRHDNYNIRTTHVRTPHTKANIISNHAIDKKKTHTQK